MANRAENDIETTDAEFERLFSALDSVKASDELKSSTIDAIFSLAAEDPACKVVELPHKPKLVGGKGKKSNAHRLRIAGVAACLAVFGVGTVAYNMPTSYACVEDDDTTLTLGINSFGMTVSAQADSEHGDDILANSDVKSKNYRDAVGALASAIADESEPGSKSISLSVSSDDDSKRAAIKKGSSEAIEISGYKKTSPAKSADSSASPAGGSTVANASAPAASQGQSPAGSEKRPHAEEQASTFEIEVDEDSKKSAENAAAEDLDNKYHPLVDDKNDPSEASSETEPAKDSPASAQAEATAPAQTQKTAE